ncbi:MAG: hypothetical protein ACYDHW_00345 [Syntrophorhabdaceae bacterium]
MIKFEGKIKNTEEYQTPSDIVEIEGELNGRQCRIIIEADDIAMDLVNLYGDKENVPINIGNGDEF